MANLDHDIDDLLATDLWNRTFQMFNNKLACDFQLKEIMPAEPKLEKPTFDRMRLSTYFDQDAWRYEGQQQRSDNIVKEPNLQIVKELVLQ